MDTQPIEDDFLAVVKCSSNEAMATQQKINDYSASDENSVPTLRQTKIKEIMKSKWKNITNVTVRSNDICCSLSLEDDGGLDINGLRQIFPNAANLIALDPLCCLYEEFSFYMDMQDYEGVLPRKLEILLDKIGGLSAVIASDPGTEPIRRGSILYGIKHVRAAFQNILTEYEKNKGRSAAPQNLDLAIFNLEHKLVDLRKHVNGVIVEKVKEKCDIQQFMRSHNIGEFPNCRFLRQKGNRIYNPQGWTMEPYWVWTNETQTVDTQANEPVSSVTVKPASWQSSEAQQSVCKSALVLWMNFLIIALLVDLLTSFSNSPALHIKFWTVMAAPTTPFVLMLLPVFSYWRERQRLERQ